MVPMAGGLAALLTVGVFVVAAALLGHWLLEPVNRAAGHLNAPTRFLLTDFIWLMIQLQLMLGLALYLLRDAEDYERFQLAILGGLAVPLVVLWAASVSVVSRAGITEPLRRAIVILVLVPGALAEIMAVPLLLVASIVAATAGPDSWYIPFLDDNVTSRITLLVMALIGALTWAVAVRWMSFWVIGRREASAAVGR